MIVHGVELNKAKGWWVIAHKHNIWMPESQTQLSQGLWQDIPFDESDLKSVVYTGELQGQSIYSCELKEPEKVPESQWHSLRRFLGVWDEDTFFNVGRCLQLNLFLATHKFCGRCGESMTLVEEELACECQSCHFRAYPRVSPCIIVAVRHKGKILLARSPRHPEGFYSVLAGFVESGESLEQAVHREVMEEVGVAIDKLEYFGSQPWPFPHSIMAAFTAEARSPEIAIDDDEIIEADWFDLDNLPQIPPNSSISGKLVWRTEEIINKEHQK